ncbi:MAG: TonB-dependent receptor plug domain-containing protein [Fodinibius sp.]|nr:TonB-dependent receptor plug domain-containing protein [Fodinibius sp.]
MNFINTHTSVFNSLSKLILAGLFVFVGSLPLAAQDSTTADTSIVSKEVVISSSRIPQTAAGSGRNITILSDQMINEMPAPTTDQVLRYVPGIEVQSRGAFGVQSDFSLRGSTFSQVLVLVDGMRINDPLTAHFNGYIPVAPAEIQKIEVLRGPAAAQYGADAVGGVINIITKTFAATGSQDVTSANVEVGYGQDDLKLAKGGIFKQDDSFRFGAGGMWHGSPGQQLAPDYKNRFSIGNISASAGAKLQRAVGPGAALRLRLPRF